MQFNISIIAVEKATATSKAGKPYQLVELSYKNLQSGKVEGSKINQYSNIYSIASQAQVGEAYSVTKEKVGEFWNWTGLSKTDAAAATAAAPASTGNVAATSAAVRSNYETPEERAKKQVYIVKQSSLAQATALAVGGNTTVYSGKKPSLEDILAVAQVMSDFVFGDVAPAKKLVDLPNDLPGDEDVPF